jgi:hypothetical protein
LLGEGIREIAPAAPARIRAPELRAQALELLAGELEHEIRWKAPGAALDGLHQHAGLDPVDARQIVVEHDVLTADDDDPPLDPTRRHQGMRHDVSISFARLRSQPVTSNGDSPQS